MCCCGRRKHNRSKRGKRNRLPLEKTNQLLLLWLLSWNEAATVDVTLPILQALSLFNHFQPFAVGIIELRDVFYFCALAACFVWGTLRVLEARQWRGRR